MVLPRSINQITIENNDSAKPLYIHKKYSSIRRYACEKKYLFLCKYHNIDVPNMIKSNDIGRSITMEFVNGVVKNELSREELDWCLSKLLLFQKSMMLSKKQIEYSKKYISLVEKNVRLISIEMGLRINEEKLLNDIMLLKAYFKPALFKDAKPTNWIFSKNRRVVMIDFDYVTPSFFLADVAQLISYQNSLKDLNIFDILRKFIIKKYEGDILNIKIFERLFYLAILNSNVMSQHYNSNLDRTFIEKFRKDNYFIISEKLKYVATNRL